MLKSFNDLIKFDVSQFCETRKAKDDKGKEIDVAYLGWAKCKQLLHENGAESVYYEPIANDNGSFVFVNAEVETKATDRYESRKCGCYFVKVRVYIDDKKFDYAYPLMNGANIVYSDTLNQLRISNAHARAFVKAVAIHTGLGFSLWLKENEEEAALRTLEEEDLSKHSIFAIKKRVEELLTFKIQNSGKAKGELLKQLGMTEKGLVDYFNFFDRLNRFEQAIKDLK